GRTVEFLQRILFQPFFPASHGHDADGFSKTFERIKWTKFQAPSSKLQRSSKVQIPSGCAGIFLDLECWRFLRFFCWPVYRRFLRRKLKCNFYPVMARTTACRGNSCAPVARTPAFGPTCRCRRSGM